ncbi:MAG: hypothetical protein FJ404_14060 [Verrucomicrobia bacterium]|nr:hypothetical protein [Verrucomicrobiota bacterium]
MKTKSLCLAALALMLGLFRGSAAEAVADPVLAKGKGFEIKKSEVDEAFRQTAANARLRGQTIPDSQKADIVNQLLDRLVITRILVGKATAAEKADAAKKADEFVANARKQAGTEEIFKHQVTQSGMSVESLQNRYAEQMTLEMVVEREAAALTPISDEKAREFYTENASKFSKPEQLRASHILITTQDLKSGEPLAEAQKKEKKKLMEKVLARAKKGEDFGKLAKEFSEDPGSKDSGGEYTFPRGQMVPEFEAAAFALKPNEVSDIVTTQYGYHIIKLSERIPAEKVEYEKVAEDLKKTLRRQAFQAQQAEFFERIKFEAETKILSPASPASFKP